MTPRSPDAGTASPCRLCGGALHLLYDFGQQPVAGYLERTREAALAAPRFRNAVGLCPACAYVQQYTTDAHDVLVNRVYASYQATYSMSRSVQAYMQHFLDFALSYNTVRDDAYVLEIGSNDGAVLDELRRRGHRPIGLDPSADVEAAARHGYEVVRDYFSERFAREFRERRGGAGLIFARHTFEHVFDPLDFMRGMGALLAPTGIGILEIPYLRLQLMNNQFQSMTFQHISFFTVQSMQRMVREAGLELIDVRFCSMDAGSMIAVMGQKNAARGSACDPRAFVALERGWRLDAPEGFTAFYAGVDALRSSAAEQLTALGGNHTFAFGAGTKGQAILNMLGLGTDVVPCAIDETPGIAGSFVPGTGTEVRALDDPAADKARAICITAPSHVPEVLSRIRSRFTPAMPVFATAPAFHLLGPSIE